MGQMYKAFESLNIQTKLHASGRTDSGVHAFKQVMHCEVPEFWSDINKLHKHLQAKLPSSIYLRQIHKADENFHARYSTRKRAYRYIICDKEPNPFESDLITFIPHVLDIKKIKEAIALFEGEHDFGYFKKSGGASGSDIRTIYKARVYIYKDKTVLYFEANGFLRSQIRLMVAFLLKISEGKLNKKQLQEQISHRNKYNNRPAPPNGLYLSNIIY